MVKHSDAFDVDLFHNYASSEIYVGALFDDKMLYVTNGSNELQVVAMRVIHTEMARKTKF